MMFLEDFKVSARHAVKALCTAAIGAVICAGATTAVAVPNGEECNLPPTCELININGTLNLPECPRFCGNETRSNDNGPCGAPSFCAWVDLQCEDSERMRVRVRIDGAVQPDRDLDDLPVRQKVFYEIPNFCEYEEGDTFNIQIKVLDRDNMTDSECEFTVRVVCGRRPACFFNDNEREPRDNDHDEMMEMYDVQTGDVLPVFEVCAKSRCGHRARVEMFARPPFMEPAGHAKSGAGQKACIETKANDVVEGGYAEGTYWAKFRCVDLLSGRERILKVGFRYTDPEPEPEPEPETLLCEEDEAQSPNDTYAGATEIDAGDCADDMGVMINGVLDTPMVINGDVDYFRITGLDPNVSYTATIVAGMNNQNGFTNTLLGWFADEGVLVASDDNSGSRAEYSKIEFVSDGAGAVTLAITGYGDDDFNGLMTPGMPYDEYGHGGYMLLVHAIDTADTEEMPIERQADLNGDGVVDTGDLGMLIGLFGATN